MSMQSITNTHESHTHCAIIILNEIFYFESEPFVDAASGNSAVCVPGDGLFMGVTVLITGPGFIVVDREASESTVLVVVSTDIEGADWGGDIDTDSNEGSISEDMVDSVFNLAGDFGEFGAKANLNFFRCRFACFRNSLLA